MSNLATLKKWEKVFETDFDYISLEIKKTIDAPALIFLEGPLGAGKTTFAKHFLKSHEGEVFSPTYSLINEIGPYVHADFYRLKNSEEIIHLELEYYFENKKYILIEWGTKYLNDILRYVDENYSIYQLVIEIQKDYRNLKLSKLDQNR